MALNNTVDTEDATPDDTSLWFDENLEELLWLTPDARGELAAANIKNVNNAVLLPTSMLDNTL